MTLRRRLLLGALPALLALAGLGAYATALVEGLGGRVESILRANHRSIVVAQRMQEVVREVEGLLLAPAGASASDLDARVAAFVEPLRTQQGNITEEGEAAVTERLTASHARWLEACREALRRPAGPERARAWLEQVRPPGEELRAACARIVTLNQDAIVKKSRAATEAADAMRRRLVLVSLGALAALVVVGVAVADRIARPVVELTDAVRAVGKGELDRAMPVAAGQDEVATLVREVGRMTEALREYRRSSLGELIAAQQLAQAAIDSLHDPVISLGPDGRVRQVNQAAATLLGVDPDRTDPLERVPADLRTEVERARDHVLRGRGPIVPEALQRSIPAMVHGALRQVQVHATPTVVRSSGEIVGATLLVRDVTALHAAAAMKDDLLSTVAHELRTPLTSLRMALHMCLEQVAGPLSDRQQDLLGAAREDAERLHALIEGILSLSRLEEGGLAARRRPVAPAALVEAVVGPVRVAAAARRLELAVDAVAEPAVFADEDGATIALGNIVQNALRYTPEGGRITVRAAPAPTGFIRFEVQDTGEGVPPELHARLFSRFYRVPGSPPGGTGLGLSITRDVVHAHGGEVGVESAPGKGSTFWFTLPVAPPQEPS